MRNKGKNGTGFIRVVIKRVIIKSAAIERVAVIGIIITGIAINRAAGEIATIYRTIKEAVIEKRVVVEINIYL